MVLAIHCEAAVGDGLGQVCGPPIELDQRGSNQAAKADAQSEALAPGAERAGLCGSNDCVAAIVN